ncbi:MAG: outer membrane protein assembly factor BamB [Steroidobacteraceae bacterium]
MRNSLPLVALALLLAACSKDKDVTPPAELVDFKPLVRVERVYEARVSGAERELRLNLGFAIVDDQLFVAGYDGDVLALNADTGRQLWRSKVGHRITGATGASAQLVVVGSADGEIVALASDTGAEKWRTRLNGEVIAAPAVGAQAVFVRTVAGDLFALNVGDGSELWQASQQVPRLSLRGDAAPVLDGDLVVAAFDNGRVAAYARGDGAPIWDTTVSPPQGRSELERLVDIDTAVAVAGDDVFTVGFQGRVAMLQRDTGQIWWSKEMSSYRGVALDDNNAYVATTDGAVEALSRRTGASQWRQESLARRRLSTPAAGAGYVVVGDFEGYLHWLDPQTGEFLSRYGLGSEVSGRPVFRGDLLIVRTESGRLLALRAPRPQAP